MDTDNMYIVRISINGIYFNSLPTTLQTAQELLDTVQAKYPMLLVGIGVNKNQEK